MRNSRTLPASLMLLAALTLASCGGVITRTTDGLSRGLLSHDDPATVREAMPAFLLILDGLIEAEPDDVSRLSAGAGLYSAYAATFVTAPERQQRLASRALGYAERAACAEDDDLCGLRDLAFEEFSARIARHGDEPADAAPLFTLAQAWLGWIKANSADLVAVAELPRAEAVLARVLVLAPEHADAHVYAGILATVRPPALGGQPEVGRRHFERAIELTGGTDLNAKVQFAESYARLVFDRELHDRLLAEVEAAPVVAPGRTLLNTLAKQRARALMASADDYF